MWGCWGGQHQQHQAKQEEEQRGYKRRVQWHGMQAADDAESQALQMLLQQAVA